MVEFQRWKMCGMLVRTRSVCCNDPAGLLRLHGSCKSGRRGLHPKRLVPTLMVVKLNPVTDHMAGVLQCIETMAMRAQLLQWTDDTLDHAVLLWTVWRNEFLAQAVGTYQCREAAAGENQAIFAAQQEWRRHAAQRAKPGNQGML